MQNILITVSVGENAIRLHQVSGIQSQKKRGRTVSCDLNGKDFFFFISYHSCIRILSIYTIFEVEHSDADLAPAWVLYYPCVPLLVVCL